MSDETCHERSGLKEKCVFAAFGLCDKPIYYRARCDDHHNNIQMLGPDWVNRTCTHCMRPFDDGFITKLTLYKIGILCNECEEKCTFGPDFPEKIKEVTREQWIEIVKSYEDDIL